MIIIQHITKSVSEKILFEDISFKIGERQKVGLVGPNGVGKTTLLNIIYGAEEPDSGVVISTQEVIGYLSQKLVTKPHEEIGSFLSKHLEEDWEKYKIDEVLSKVGLKGIDQRTLISKLSGGQKMKVGLASILLSEPTSLLLDEPTNNLDVESIAWLEKFVQDFPGKILLISHDRYFLDNCVNKIIELDLFTHKIVEYGGNYTQYKEQKKLRHENLVDDFEEQQAKEKHMREWILGKQEQLKYHPSPKVARQLQAMKTRLEREVTRDALVKPKTYDSFNVNSLADSLHQKKVVLAIQNFTIHQLLSIPELYFFGRDRIHLSGKNGSGKTTLLKSIMKLLDVHTGTIELGTNIKIGYFSQEHEVLDPSEIMINAFMSRMEKPSETAARKILGNFLFTKQKVFSQIQYLSEGEKARLLLAIIISQKNDFLLLDEPTNHLDLESREVLADSLKEYEGGFLVISHDRYFLTQIGIEREIRIEEGLMLESTHGSLNTTHR